MNTEWKNAVRRTMDLQRTTRSRLLPLIAGVDSFQCEHERRCAMMYNKILCNENVLVSHVAKRAMYNVNDVLGHNRVLLRHKCGLPDANGIYILFDVEWPADDLHRADLIT